MFQIAEMKASAIASKLDKSKSWVSKWKDKDLSETSNFYDACRKGAPVTALTPENLNKLEDCEGKIGKSIRVMGKKLKISRLSVSRGFKSLGLFAHRRSVQSKLKPKHIKLRFTFFFLIGHPLDI